MWIIPKLDWTKDDFYNFDDLNRVENNTKVIAGLISYFESLPEIIVITNRDIKYIEFADSLNRIESNQEILRQHYTPPDWISNKLDWKANDPFDYNDAARLDKNLSLLHFYYRGNVDNFRYCGMYTCGEEVI
ncbi:hypothetical protein ACFFF5_17770 [Lederbergia wuyishanensis]|uniref:Uncharacterized protein n=1 Tax=Lederbergia wuyishanensis TaxID=1347903 RepID=A0ABU0D4G4_9BACI|nr:hypothetical protein [Lederbergia wuyishanensis]MCJ8008125.1 hypothetical protein [Lederbergia wuyishanensis]MDQ0343289.1 hypothetical protein [Lederbergia wuyishanensis]